MIVSASFDGAYNDRRYGRPWGAKISFVGPKPAYDFCGRWDGGEVVLDANPGDIVAFGQKDHRNPRNTENNLYIVKDDGTLESVTEGEARNHYMASKQSPVVHSKSDTLTAERAKLVARIAEIDAELAALK